MRTIIKNAKIVNEGEILEKDVLIKNSIIEKISPDITPSNLDYVIDASNKYLIPGVIDDQVHFREPGLTHKANIYSESKAAIAGGVTSFMEMPNTNPQTLTQNLLEEKYQIAKQKSLANFSFLMGVSNVNLDEVLKTNTTNVAGLKIFMGSSTGDMLVDDKNILEEVFSKSPMLICVHCEDENIIKANLAIAKAKYGEKIPVEEHPNIRDVKACYKSSSMAVDLAKKYNTRLHVFHISTEKELSLFQNNIPLKDKKITSEVCIHHLYFDENDYANKGSLIKWNPAIKSASDKEALLKALLNDKLDVIASDHAPHTLDEKNNPYLTCPSGGPLVQHSLIAMLDFFHYKKITLEKIVEKMCHNPAICFKIQNRGFIREGYAADLVLIDINKPWEVMNRNLLYKCKWSPFEGKRFSSQVTHTFVNGHMAYHHGKFDETKKGERLLFDRN
ncbi:MAG: dihydroorotase [Bacteroidota bacterium]|nr:dihydroorotase [Bacteroidota bacterium]